MFPFLFLTLAVICTALPHPRDKSDQLALDQNKALKKDLINKNVVKRQRHEDPACTWGDEEQKKDCQYFLSLESDEEDDNDGVSERPRPVVLSLTRRAPRDQLLRAARVRRGLTTDMLAIPVNSRGVYLNENLTKENRVLFSKARKLGAELHFKFVWTSNGAIFMRRSETSSVLQVTSDVVLDKIKAQKNTGNPTAPVDQNKPSE